MRHTLKLVSLAVLLLSASLAQADFAKDLKNAAVQKAGNSAAEKLGLPTAAPEGAKVYIISPKDGETLNGPVKVQFGLSGAGIAPAGTQVEGTGHHHLLVDDPKVDLTTALPATDTIKHFGKGQTETTLTLKPGKHTLQLLFADWKHQPFNPSIASDKITITVK
jgi:hypothetical protein